MQKKKFDRKEMENRISIIEQDTPLTGFLTGLLIVAVLVIGCMIAFSSCRTTMDSCQYVRKTMSGYK